LVFSNPLWISRPGLTRQLKNIVRQTAAAAADAAQRTAGYLKRTALVRSEAFSDDLGANVFFKLENLQTTGSFKLRGATNRLLTLTQEELAKGCVAASSGNHGAAVACALQQLGATGIIFVPEQTSDVKVGKIESYGGTVRHFGTDGLDTEQHAREYAEQNGMLYLSPYNDEQVIAGQGSCGIEILEQLPDIDAVFIAVGGGGLIGGVGSVLKAKDPDTAVYGCQPEASAVMAHSVEAGEILDIRSAATISDGTAGGIEAGAITLPLNQSVVDEFIIVDEQQIMAAMRLYIGQEYHNIEGAAGVAVAGLLAKKETLAGQNVVVIICGGNIAEDKLRAVMDQN
jgi:threonine dehydratase